MSLGNHSTRFRRNTITALEDNLRAAADAIRSADGLLIGAGAGMGVDSGLPDFRGPEGFWKAYPPFRGRQFAEMSTPHWFTTDPALAWVFFGHRLNLYRAAVPHAGFDILRRWAEKKSAFVFTSNVDGQFLKAGFDENVIVERHGTILFLQCLGHCGQPIWPTGDTRVDVDETAIRATSALPSCPSCGALARPNILMFNDRGWDTTRTEQQMGRYADWLESLLGKRIVAVELGAGLAVPTVRITCEEHAEGLIRINPREADTPPGGIGIELGAMEALMRIDELLQQA